MKAAFPWAEFMHMGLGILRLPPEQFWRTTPRELAAAFGPPRTGFNRNVLQQLMKDFPDDTN